MDEKKENMTTEEERAKFVRAAIDGWNTPVHYYDRRTKNIKMAGNAYAFYRGTDHLFWEDKGQESRLATFGGDEDTATWLSGDAHAYNCGSFHSDKDGTVVFGLNDFDESVVADYQLDLWRLAVSFVLIGRENKNLTDDEMRSVVDAISAAYLERMIDLVTGEVKIDELFTKDNTSGKLDDFLDIIEGKNNPKKMLDKWAPINEMSGRRSFNLASEKLGSATNLEKEALRLALQEDYSKSLEDPNVADPERFKILDIARRLVAGTGSLGMDRFYVLVETHGPDEEEGTCRILDVKEQSRPCPVPFMGAAAKRVYDSHASMEQDGKTVHNVSKAVVSAARAMSTYCPNPYTGWLEMNGLFYSVQERSPWKGSFPALLEEATGKFKNLALDSPTRYEKIAKQMAAVFAQHHAIAHRRLQRKKNLEQSIVDGVGEQEEAFVVLVRTVAFEYADQVKEDYQAFKDGLNADMQSP